MSVFSEWLFGATREELVAYIAKEGDNRRREKAGMEAKLREAEERAEKAEREMHAILDTLPVDVVVRVCECSGPAPVAAALAASVSKLRSRTMTAEIERDEARATGRRLLVLVMDLAPYPPEVAEGVLALVANARAALGETP